MIAKTILLVTMLAGCIFIGKSAAKKSIVSQRPIDKAWWDSLSEEWKTILLINQNFRRQRSDISTLQNGYINRLNSADEADYSEMNTSLHELFEKKKFSLGYRDFYARALRYKFVKKNDIIDLATLGDLDNIYMVNGPGDLTPLAKFSNLKILILTDCGVDNAIPVAKQVLDLEPLRNLKKLQVLHCSSTALKSIEPIKELTDLQELRLDNSSVTDLSPLKNMVNLDLLSVGAHVESAPVISGLVNLKALYLNGCKQIPDLSKLQELKKLAVEENEMAILDGSFRIKSIEFLKDLPNLEYVDLANTSFNGDLSLLDSFQQLKAIALPPVNRAARLNFKQHHNDCVIINASLYEW